MIQHLIVGQQLTLLAQVDVLANLDHLLMELSELGVVLFSVEGALGMVPALAPRALDPLLSIAIIDGRLVGLRIYLMAELTVLVLPKVMTANLTKANCLSVFELLGD